MLKALPFFYFSSSAESDEGPLHPLRHLYILLGLLFQHVQASASVSYAFWYMNPATS